MTCEFPGCPAVLNVKDLKVLSLSVQSYMCGTLLNQAHKRAWFLKIVSVRISVHV